MPIAVARRIVARYRIRRWVVWVRTRPQLPHVTAGHNHLVVGEGAILRMARGADWEPRQLRQRRILKRRMGLIDARIDDRDLNPLSRVRSAAQRTPGSRRVHQLRGL